jgi:hypothetical protein
MDYYNDDRAPVRGTNTKHRGLFEGIELFNEEGQRAYLTQEDITKYEYELHITDGDAEPLLQDIYVEVRNFILDFSQSYQVRHFVEGNVWNSACYHNKEEVIVQEWEYQGDLFSEWSVPRAQYFTQKVVLEELRQNTAFGLPDLEF